MQKHQVDCPQGALCAKPPIGTSACTGSGAWCAHLRGRLEKLAGQVFFEFRHWRSFNQRTTGGAERSPNVNPADLMQCPDVTVGLAGRPAQTTLHALPLKSTSCCIVHSPIWTGTSLALQALCSPAHCNKTASHSAHLVCCLKLLVWQAWTQRQALRQACQIESFCRMACSPERLSQTARRAGARRQGRP